MVADQRSPRDGRTIETIGQYNPQTDPSLIKIDQDPPSAMRELLEFLARSLVAEPDAVVVTEVEEIEGEVVLEVEVAEDDLGRVIGRGGRVANALLSVIKAAATREEKRVVVDILD